MKSNQIIFFLKFDLKKDEIGGLEEVDHMTYVLHYDIKIKINRKL